MGSTQSEKIFQDQNSLPSSYFKHHVWHQLQFNKIKGNELKSPRIRIGPEESENILEIKQLSKLRINKPMENWKEATVVNFSYQDLGHDYQLKSFMRIMNKLKNCEDLNLVDDSLRSLRNLTFKKCQKLNLKKNFIMSFNDLPKCPIIKHLNLAENNINKLDGLSQLKSLISLDLSRNPIQYEANYRKMVFSEVPSLQVLDGVNKTQEDENYFPSLNSSTCIVS